MTNVDVDVYYDSAVQRIGDEAADLAEGGVWILYADPIPEALESMSIVHAPTGPLGRDMRAGDRLWIGDECVELTAVGERANENLRTLGHVVMHFDAGDTQLLPGAVHVSGSAGTPAAGTRIRLSSS